MKNKTTKKHVAMRTCIATREKLPKKELARFVLLSDSDKTSQENTRTVVFDPKGKARGRGANLKKSLETFDNAVKSGAFNRALKTKVTQENLQQLRDEFEKYLHREEMKGEDDSVTLRVKVDEKVTLG